MRIQRPDGTVLEADFTGVALDRLPVQQGDFSIVELQEQSVVFEFPLVDEDGTELQVVFDNSVLRFGTTFSGQVFNTENGQLLGQGVVAGNAADLGDGDSDVQPLGTPFEGNLSVEVPISGDLLVNVAVAPRVFTPNGDGVNDLTMIQYDLTNVGSPTGLAIAIYDLAGRPVRRLYDDLDNSGRFARVWDGRDDTGQVVPPGNYVFSVTLAAKIGQRKVLAAVGVAY